MPARYQEVTWRAELGRSRRFGLNGYELRLPFALLPPPIPLPPIVRELDLITQFAPDEVIHHERQRLHEPHDQAAERNAERRLRSKGRGKSRRRLLLALRPRHQPLFVTRKGGGVIAAASVQLARQDITSAIARREPWPARSETQAAASPISAVHPFFQRPSRI